MCPGRTGGAGQQHAAIELGQLVAADACKLNFEALPCPSNGTLRCRGDAGPPPAPKKPAAEDAFGPEAEGPHFWPEICQWRKP